MAAILVSYLDSIGSKISGTHNIAIVGGGYQVSCSSDNTSDKASASSEFSFPSLNFAKTSVINSITCTATASNTTNATGGHSLALVFDGSSYSIGDDGKISSEAISHLNNYKSQNGEFPSIVLQLDSWVSRPPANDDGSAAAYVYTVIFSKVIIELTIQGSKLILRPSADVSVEHSIPSGFTGVYQLINEEVADDATTCIGEIVEAEGDEKIDSSLTSVVSLMGGSFSKKNVVLMKPVFRYNIINPTTYGDGSVTCSVIVGDESISFSDNTDTANVYVTNDTWTISSSIL